MANLRNMVGFIDTLTATIDGVSGVNVIPFDESPDSKTGTRAVIQAVSLSRNLLTGREQDETAIAEVVVLAESTVTWQSFEDLASSVQHAIDRIEVDQFVGDYFVSRRELTIREKGVRQCLMTVVHGI